jgi:hypothetical protein
MDKPEDPASKRGDRIVIYDPHAVAAFPLPDLAIKGVSRVLDNEHALMIVFSRTPSDDEVRAMHELPPSPIVARDAQRFAERVILSELVVRLFRTLVLGNVVVEDTPKAMEWLKDYIDGAVRGHGPIGQPMIWPDRLPFVVGLLRQWGFQPTPTVPPYVTRKPAQPVTKQ